MRCSQSKAAGCPPDAGCARVTQGTLALGGFAPRVCVRWRFDAEFNGPHAANPNRRKVKGQCGRQTPALRVAPRVCVRWRFDAEFRSHRTSDPNCRHAKGQCGRQTPALRVGATNVPAVASGRRISRRRRGNAQRPPRQRPVRATSPRTAGWRHECACGGGPTRNSDATLQQPARRAAHPAQRATSARTIIHNRVTQKPPRVDAGHPAWEPTEPMMQRCLPGISTVPRPQRPPRQCGPAAHTARTSPVAAPRFARPDAHFWLPG